MDEQELPLTEEITRYLFKGDFDVNSNVKPKAFRPARKDYAVSIYRNGALDIEGCESALNESEIWILADQMIGERPHRGGVIARTDFQVSHVVNSSLDLTVVEYRKDHDRHGHIQPYPVIVDEMSEAEKRKAENRRLTISTKLAQNLTATKRE